MLAPKRERERARAEHPQPPSLANVFATRATTSSIRFLASAWLVIPETISENATGELPSGAERVAAQGDGAIQGAGFGMD